MQNDPRALPKALLIVAVVLGAAPAFADTRPSDGLAAALLGQGYDVEGGTLRAVCVEGTVTYEGAARSTARLDRPLTPAELDRALGLVDASGAPLPAMPERSRLRFSSEATPREGSVVLTYAYDVRGRFATISQARPTALGREVVSLPEATRTLVCGHEALRRVELGGSLFVTIRFDFSSREAERTFVRDVDLGHASTANLAGKLRRVGAEYRGRVAITVSALQIGGDASALGRIFATGLGDVPILRCQVDDVESCATAMESVRAYIIGDDGFRAQLGDLSYDPSSTRGPAIVAVTTTGYVDLGLPALAPTTPPGTVAREARSRLAARYRALMFDVDRLDAQRALPLTPAQEEAVTRAAAIARDNAALTASALSACGSRPEQCLTLEAEAQALQRPYSTDPGP